jgi:hypothetical protein
MTNDREERHESWRPFLHFTHPGAELAGQREQTAAQLGAQGHSKARRAHWRAWEAIFLEGVGTSDALTGGSSWQMALVAQCYAHIHSMCMGGRQIELHQYHLTLQPAPIEG